MDVKAIVEQDAKNIGRDQLFPMYTNRKVFFDTKKELKREVVKKMDNAIDRIKGKKNKLA